ncbi:hypothetical protein D9M72_581380 [compost metagenome]
MEFDPVYATPIRRMPVTKISGTFADDRAEKNTKIIAICSARPVTKTGLRPMRSERMPASGPMATAARLATAITVSISPFSTPTTDVA